MEGHCECGLLCKQDRPLRGEVAELSRETTKDTLYNVRVNEVLGGI